MSRGIKFNYDMLDADEIINKYQELQLCCIKLN